MKKFYLFIMLGIAVLGTNRIYAQCGGIAKSTAIGDLCVVAVAGMPPGSTIGIYNTSATLIGHGTISPSGTAYITYDCSDFAYEAVLFYETANPCTTQITAQTPLPVKLTSFNATLNADNKVALKWTSSMELTSFKYVVQKSNDGLNFSDIGNVAAAGNSFAPIDYTFSDNNFVSGASYFRLKQVDIDGRDEYSKVVYVNNKNSGGTVTSVTPNPFVSDVQLIGISSSELNPKNVQLYNSFGQRVNYRISGSNAIEISPSAAKGIYILKVKQQTFKLVKN